MPATTKTFKTLFFSVLFSTTGITKTFTDSDYIQVNMEHNNFCNTCVTAPCALGVTQIHWPRTPSDLAQKSGLKPPLLNFFFLLFTKKNGKADQFSTTKTLIHYTKPKFRAHLELLALTLPLDCSDPGITSTLSNTASKHY